LEDRERRALQGAADFDYDDWQQPNLSELGLGCFMRYLILSDIHANVTALDTVLADAKGRWDAAVCLGDIVGYGPDPNEALDRIRELNCVTIRGNHDKAIAGITEAEDFNPVARTAVLWSRDRLTSDNLGYLSNLRQGPVFVDGFCIVHGSIRDEDEYLFVPPQAIEELRIAPTVLTFFGHTHRQGGFMQRRNGLAVINFELSDRTLIWTLPVEEGGTYLLNPGSIGQPRDGDPRAAYAIADTEKGTVEFWRVAYDIEAVQQRMLDALLPEPLILRLAVGR
jgi:predicted phosphodiesterase